MLPRLCLLGFVCVFAVVGGSVLVCNLCLCVCLRYLPFVVVCSYLLYVLLCMCYMLWLCFLFRVHYLFIRSSAVEQGYVRVAHVAQEADLVQDQTAERLLLLVCSLVSLCDLLLCLWLLL